MFLFPPPTNVEIAQICSEDHLSVSRIQSLHHLLEVDYHHEEECSVALRHWIVGGRIILWFNIGPRSFPNGHSFCGWAGRDTSLWFCFSLLSARKSTCFRFQRKNFELHLWGFLLVVVPAPSCSSSWWAYSSHEKFWLTSENGPCSQT